MRYDFTYQQAAQARARHQRTEAIVALILSLFRRIR
jgi:hypothetical protein